MTATRTASTLRRLAGTVLVVGVIAGCGGGTGSTPSAAPTTAPTTTAPATTAPGTSAPGTAAPATSAPATSMPGGDQADALSLKMADTALGSILVDGRGMTLYMYTKDSANISVCEGQCLVNWPPLLGRPTAGGGVDDSKLGSFTRADGRAQATYNGWPLYYWIRDTKPGDTTGQDVQGVWYVLGRDGEPIK